MTEGTPKLRSLSPEYVPEQHNDYVEILKAELTKSGPDAPRNIALTGHYGSGKSSVLLRAHQELERAGVNVINLSLPSLGIGDGRIRNNGDISVDRTNLIQKEIVKQLLYRRKPSNMPASRYSRLDTFDRKRALGAAVVVGVVVTGIALLASVPSRVRDALPKQAWAWIDDHLWTNLAGTLQWLSLLAIFVLTVFAAHRIQRLLQQRIRVTELAAGPTKVTLSDSSSSYFDEYLDEIVYFFQMSKTAVVVFEDLDRFKDPHIFETLRELNILLNNAEQTGQAPIRFVYAIRDSIFEQLDAEDGNENACGNAEEAANSVDKSETRRLMSTNRTKFFDLVVPMVPFISHRTSRDFIRQELEKVVPKKRPGRAVVDIVGAHLTDMRLIKNICNEYEMFRRRILADDGLKELTPDRLFALIVYKNLYLADYEKIRNGTSQLDTLYRAYRDWVAQQTAKARNAERMARDRMRRIDAIGSRSAKLGARLQKVLLARYAQNLGTRTPEVVFSGIIYSWQEIASERFWRAYLKEQGDMEVRYRGAGYRGDFLPFDQVEILMGYRLSPGDWEEEARADANKEIIQAVADQRTAQHASMVAALRLPDKLFSYAGEDRSVAYVAAGLFEGADLVLDLLEAGLIDENYTLYTTQFPGQAISASAMNYIIKAVQPNVMDIEYHFGTGDDVDVSDIKAVVDAEESRLLGGQSVYNVEVFDYLMTADPAKLDDPIRRLVASADTDRAFIDAYMTSGKAAPALAERLSSIWPEIFDYLIGADPDAVGNQELLDAALRGVRPDLAYTMSSEQRDVLAAVLPDLSTVNVPQGEQRAVAIAETIRRAGIRVNHLNRVAEPLRTELSKRSVYPITLRNLVAIFGAEDLIALDSIKALRESDVYVHVLSNMGDYLSALGESTSNVPTVADPEAFADVISDVGGADVDALEAVASGASADCMLSDLSQLDPPLWPAIAGAHRLDLTARNVAAYIAQHGVDSDLAIWLRDAGTITVATDDSTPLVPVALHLLNAAALRDEAALHLVEGLGIAAGTIAAVDLEKDAHTLLPALVERQLVPDDAGAYAVLEDDEWAIKRELIAASCNFPVYMSELSLSTNELFLIASEAVPDTVKDVLLAELEKFPHLGPKGAIALATWSAAQNRTPSPEAIVMMANRGGSGSARPILELLGTQADTIGLEQLKSALNALGRPYSQVTAPGRDRPKIENSVGVSAVLSRLRRANIVSKYEENKRKRVFEVSKRHS